MEEQRKQTNTVQVFIFGAGRQNNTLSSTNTQLVLQKLIRGQRVLDWTLHGLEEASILRENITFVGGYRIEKIMETYPELNYVVNPKWHNTHVVGSLRYALDAWKGGDVLLLYADTLFRPRVFSSILAHPGSVVLGVDRQWKERIQDSKLQRLAEKVIVRGNIVQEIGREVIRARDAHAQFSGLTLLKSDVVEKIHAHMKHADFFSHSVSEQDRLCDFLSVIQRDWNIPLHVLDISRDFAELDSRADLAKFVFGTKAETLERVKPLVQNATLCEQAYFSVRDWAESANGIVGRLQKEFPGQTLIIRSSSHEEDSWNSSLAGAFRSIAGVLADDTARLKNAIEEVIQGFSKNEAQGENPDNQVLVQPLVGDVAMSGVVFSRHLETGAPYYVINYDDVSARTDTVTSGTSADTKTVTIYKNAAAVPKNPRLQKAIQVVEELERITGYPSLDIEFVITNTEELYVVQVRPIITHAGFLEDPNFARGLNEVQKKIASRLKRFPHIFGETTILSDMTDWNPAEMIGVRPTPLALSLYQHLICNAAWREARAAIGYHNPVPEPLLFCIGGHPYIDVRNSFNNLIPQGLSPALAEKLVNHYLRRLRENPELHDKVEFDILITCITPDFHAHTARLRNDGFSGREIEELQEALRVLTERIVQEKDYPIEKLLASTETLHERREKHLGAEYTRKDIPGLVYTLLEDCIRQGTVPFSMLARYGFISAALLRGFVEKGIVTEIQAEEFLNSIETVAGRMVSDMGRVLAGSLAQEEFLRSYGHLRPGTYDITSFSYREKPEYYFPEHASGVSPQQYDVQSTNKQFRFSDKVLTDMDEELKRMGVNCTGEQLVQFMRNAIAAREYAKFQFTKNISSVFEILAAWGEQYGFSREDLSYLCIEDILMLHTRTFPEEPKQYLAEKIQKGREWYEKSYALETPHIIFSPNDLEIITHSKTHPNFITSHSVRAPICRVTQTTHKSELQGKIALIEGADPGYDWIFMHSIKGLITKYGGAASHMTIRCAEFGLPAAIGVGEEWYNVLKKTYAVELNSGNKTIRVIQ